MIRKADIILAIILIVLGLIVSYTIASDNDYGSMVSITVNGEHYAEYPLSDDRDIEIKQDGHINKITIKDSHVSMSFSDCSNQDCVLHHAISKTFETIVCLPNKVIAEITGGESQFDAVAK
jgi:hypothetical protein